MEIPSVGQLIPVLQTAIGPVILISGIGLLLLTMTNRLGRAIDRARILVGRLPNTTEAKREKTVAQLRILWGRARMIRLAIALASISALAAAILIIALFFTALWQIESAWIIVALFVACMASLIGSLVIFIRDINQSLEALKLELVTEEIVSF
ncbi:MAG: DUF2721 domain-containing protein [Anaerolineales bacterium]|nr:DUF2721 domain-containing protein [Anaerolineales bacterium]MCK5633784.1 DUF2721 domain-containing protein [Anaerolineales bacterium]